MKAFSNKQGEETSPNGFHHARESLAHVHAFFVLFVLLAGGIYVMHSLRQADRRLRADLMARTRLLSAAVNPVRVKALRAAAGGAAGPSESGRLQAQLTAVRQAAGDIRSICLLSIDRAD